jgi:hypothetical protein
MQKLRPKGSRFQDHRLAEQRAGWQEQKLPLRTRVPRTQRVSTARRSQARRARIILAIHSLAADSTVVSRRLRQLSPAALTWQELIAVINSLDFRLRSMSVRVSASDGRPLNWAPIATKSTPFKTHWSSHRLPARNLVQLPGTKYGLVRYGEEDNIYEARGMRKA